MIGSLDDLDDVVPVILAGGSGTRLWPLSRANHPKHLVQLTSERSLLQETAKRAVDVLPNPMRLVTVASARQADLIRRQLGDLDPALGEHVVLEPAPRNTAAAVALAALYVRELFSEQSLIWVCPSDHLILRPEQLYQAVQLGAQAARQGQLVTFGIEPSRPEPGFGYIARGTPLRGLEGAFKAKHFVEKPDRETAQAMLDTGNYSWNSGIFLMRTGTILDELKSFEPELIARTETAYENADTARQGDINLDAFGAIKSMPIDKAVMERSDRVVVIPCDPKWSDVGSWHALWEISEKDENDNAISGDAIAIDTHNTLIRGEHRLIATAGVQDLAIVDTEDALLIANREQSAMVREIAGTLDQAQRYESVHHLRQIESWGQRRQIECNSQTSLYELKIDTGAHFSPEPEPDTKTIFTVVEGTAAVTTLDQCHNLNSGQSLTVKAGQDVRIDNTNGTPLRLIQLSINGA